MVQKFIWKDIYSVGIPSIDDQHKDFFSTANEIVNLFDTKADLEKNVIKEKLRAALRKLVEHGDIHFRTEEGYFDRLHYSGAAEHERAHESYRKKVARFAEELEKPDADVPLIAEDIANYSIFWLSDHILQVDKQYSIFFQEHGVK